MSVRRSFPNCEGMSLVAALVALVILAVAMTGLADAFYRSMRNNGSAGGVTGLAQLAQKMTERIMLLPDNDSMVVGGGSAISPEALQLTSPSDYDSARFTATASIAGSGITIDGRDSQLQKVSVTAQYTPGFAQLMTTTPEGSAVTVITYRYRSE